MTALHHLARPLSITFGVLAMVAGAPAARAASVTRPAGDFSVTPPAGSGTWNNPSFTTGNADGFCGATLAGTIKLFSYGFTIPADATITGVAVSLTVSSPENSLDTQLVLVTAGGSSAPRSFNAPNSVSFPNCGGPLASGGDGDLWGFTSPALTAADVNDAAFGLRITGTGNEGLGPWRLDAALVTVFYTAPPGAPTLLDAASAQNEVTLGWTDNANDETDFRIERALDVPSPAFAEVGTSPANTATFHDGSAACNTAYLYRVRAFRQGDGAYSAYSNTDGVTHACPDLVVSKSASASIVLVNQTWTWTLAIANGGSGPATIAASQTLLSDALPGASYGNVIVTPGGGVTGTISCGIAASTLTCSATNTVTIPASAGVTVSLDGSSPTPADLVNGGSGCTVDPADALEETIEANNACNASMVSVRLAGIFGDGFEGGALPGPWTGGSTP